MELRSRGDELRVGDEDGSHDVHANGAGEDRRVPSCTSCGRGRSGGHHPDGSGSNSPDVDGLKTEPLKGSFMEIVAYIFDPRHLRYDHRMAKTFRALETRDTSDHVSFLVSTLDRLVLHVCILDILQTTLQVLPLPGVGTPNGGSIYNNNVPVPLRY
ncbi:hypothetical protein FRB90_004850, partial [Tulasnella sp. 427]